MAIVYYIAEAIRIVVTLTAPLSDKILDVITYLWIGRTRVLPPIKNKILLMSATELVEKIRKRQISCEEIMKAYIERSKSVHRCINAVVDERYDDALKDARNIDRFLASNAKSEEEIARDTPLLGLPFTCKEVLGIKGMAQTAGLVRSKGRVAKEDSHAAALYRKAGAIPVTVTNVPELSMWWDAYNHLFGWTRNPYDNWRVVGGSTGGEAALITSAGALFGLGHDMCGSIRVPAAFCGIYGHKPSRGIVPNFGPYPACEDHLENDNTEGLCGTGPLCRYAQDINLLMKVLSENDKRLQLDHKVNFKRVKLYYMEDFPGFLTSAVPSVKNAVKKAVKHFEEEYNIKATPLRIDELKYGFSIYLSKHLECGMPSIPYYLAGKGKKINLWWELFKNLLCCSNYTLSLLYFSMIAKKEKDACYHKSLKKYQEIERKVNEVIQNESTILIVPTHPEPAPHFLMTISKLPNTVYTFIFNMIGLPCTQIPAGLDSKGLPIGIQAISGRFNDHLTLATAVELERVFSGWQSPSAVSV